MAKLLVLVEIDICVCVCKQKKTRLSHNVKHFPQSPIVVTPAGCFVGISQNASQGNNVVCTW